MGNPSNRTRDSAYWAFRTLFNVVKLKYGPFQSQVVTAREPIEAASLALVASLDKQPSANLTAAYIANADAVVSQFWALSEQILNVWYDTAPEYPAWWLQAVGYSNGPPPPPSS